MERRPRVGVPTVASSNAAVPTMSHANSSSDGGREWPRYGLVPLIRCPDCHRGKLVRLITKKSENGNAGREFVKCEYNSQSVKVMKCNFFMWLENYIDMLNEAGVMSILEGLMASKVGHEEAARSRCRADTNWDSISAEMKMINENLRKILVVLYAYMICVSLFLLVSLSSKHQTLEYDPVCSEGFLMLHTMTLDSGCKKLRFHQSLI